MWSGVYVLSELFWRTSWSVVFSQVWRRSIFKFCVYKLAEAVRYLKFKWEFVIIGRGCLVLLKFKFLCRRMLCFKALQRLCSSGIKLPCVNPTSLRADSQWIIILKTFELVTLSLSQFHAQRNWLLAHALVCGNFTAEKFLMLKDIHFYLLCLVLNRPVTILWKKLILNLRLTLCILKTLLWIV